MDVFGWEKPVVGLLVTVFQIPFRCVYSSPMFAVRCVSVRFSSLFWLLAVFQHGFRRSREWSVSLRACSSDIADSMWC